MRRKLSAARSHCTSETRRELRACLPADVPLPFGGPPTCRMALDRILPFLAEIGIVVRERPLAAPTFLPGILIERGELVIDREKLAHPGDLLHEAGHIAVMPPSVRPQMNDGDLQSGPGEEMAAIAWSYAAAQRIGLDPAVVFHPAGYKNEAASLLENFAAGRYIGVPLLQWYGLTKEREDGSGAPVYPRMSRWLRAEPQMALA